MSAVDDTALAAARRAYARKVVTEARVDDPRIEAAFAGIKREDFLGRGPWLIWGLPPGFRPKTTLDSIPGGYRRTPDDNPIHLYDDVLIGIMPRKGLNNGAPHFLAFLIDLGRLREGEHAVHIGAGVGYYTAIMATLVGDSGRVTAVEYEPKLAARAAANLTRFPNVRVIQGDGSAIALEPADVIYVNAGASKPARVWLDALKDGGRLILPLTTTYVTDGHAMTSGAIFRIERKGDEYFARWMSPTAIYACAGGQDPESMAALAAAFQKGGWEKVTRLYRTSDIPDERCWVRGEGWALAYS